MRGWGRRAPLLALLAAFRSSIDGFLRLFAKKMTRFGAVRVLGELGALSAARASSTMPAAGAVPTEVPGKHQTTVLRRPKEAIFHYCRAILKL